MLSNPLHQQVAELHAMGRDAPRISEAVSRSIRTVQRVLARCDVQEELETLRRNALQRTMDRLSSAGEAAADTMLALLEGGQESTRMRAAESILGMASKLRTERQAWALLGGLEERVNRLLGGTDEPATDQQTSEAQQTARRI